MACEGFVSGNLVIGVLAALFTITSILLLQANSENYEKKKTLLNLRHDVTQLNREVIRLKDELDGPAGCNAQV